MKMIHALRWEVRLQGRNGFYYASAFVVVAVSALLLSMPQAMREAPAVWVPAIVSLNLQITTFFFVAGLLLLERDEGTLNALAVSPLSASGYLAAKTLTLTLLAVVETAIIVLVAFGDAGFWIWILAGAAAMSVTYTALGVAIATRYESVNTLLLPASVLVTLLLLPLLPHFGLVSRIPFLAHPIEPGLALMRAGYVPSSSLEMAFAIVGSATWAAISFSWARRGVRRLMRDTRATGGR